MTRILFVGLLVVVLALFIRLWVGIGSYPDIWHLKGQIVAQNLDNDEKDERNRQLKLDVEGAERDSSAVEEHARSELGLVKQDETFYQVILKSDISDSTANLPTPIKDSSHVE